MIDYIKIGTATAGIKKNGTDCVVIELPTGTETAAIFTQNQYCAAPVMVAKQHLQHTTQCRALLINSGNANCGLGEQGLYVAEQSTQLTAQQLGCEAQQILTFSTGVINTELPLDKLRIGIEKCCAQLGKSTLHDAANAIMTTDTKPKYAQRSIEVDGQVMQLSGIAKGSGMIQPNMATMLAFLFTDVKLPADLLQRALQHAANCSFNRISVDGDTSTNDACTLSSIASSTVAIDSDQSPLWQPWLEALCALTTELALAIVDDGEGATKRLLIQVKQCKEEHEGLQVAYAIANSPLVKTALFAGDPNLGRIAAALGNSGIADIDWSKVNMHLDNLCIMRHGQLPTDYQEEQALKIMQQRNIELTISLGRGNQGAHVWTCDLSYDYVKINAEYRT